ncbi:unnamed protein product [Rhizoctonia solani]|uniref:Uncharacterized protein n=1 Tax=Rhizoctonia solani TaxID=456999 RepID=A0A8H3DPI5_9AGAM|nr:unnamed protein product [Rhizoctonia solani]
MKLTKGHLAFFGTNYTLHPDMVDPTERLRRVILWNATPLTDKKRTRAPFNQLESPHSGPDFDDYDTLAAVQEILKENVGKRYRYLQNWRLIGYKSKYEKDYFLLERYFGGKSCCGFEGAIRLSFTCPLIV